MAAKCCGSGSCMTRTPYATIIGLIICLAGVGVFCATYFRGVGLTRLMFEEVFRFRIDWLHTIQIAIVVVAAVLGAIGLMVLVASFLATGETRSSVYRAWQTRVGGRITCAVFIVIIYLYEVAMLAVFGTLVVVTCIFYLCGAICSDKIQPYGNHNCVDFVQIHFLFPPGTRPEEMKVCEPIEMKLFCKDYVSRAQIMFLIASISCGIVILSLAHMLMCLSANYAHIKDHKKLKDYQDIYYHNLHPEHQQSTLALGGGKDRYEDEAERLP